MILEINCLDQLISEIYTHIHEVIRFLLLYTEKNNCLPQERSSCGNAYSSLAARRFFLSGQKYLFLHQETSTCNTKMFFLQQAQFLPHCKNIYFPHLEKFEKVDKVCRIWQVIFLKEEHFCYMKIVLALKFFVIDIFIKKRDFEGASSSFKIPPHKVISISLKV